MRAALYLLCLLAIVPYAALALGFAVLDRAIASGSLASFILVLLLALAWLVPWGLLGALALVAVLVVLGFAARQRWIGALALLAMAMASLLVITWLAAAVLGPAEWLFLSPCMAAAVLAGWLAAQEWPRPAAGLPAGRPLE